MLPCFHRDLYRTLCPRCAFFFAPVLFVLFLFRFRFIIVREDFFPAELKLICCSARNTAHVGDLYPASSNLSVRFVSFRIVLISACSWPSQHSCFFKKFHPPLVIAHPRPGSRHVGRPSVVMILVSSTRSSHTCDESWILTNPFTV